MFDDCNTGFENNDLPDAIRKCLDAAAESAKTRAKDGKELTVYFTNGDRMIFDVGDLCVVGNILCATMDNGNRYFPLMNIEFYDVSK